MKTTLLILFSTCCGLLAQTASSVGGGSDPVPREAATNVLNFSGIDLNTFLDIYGNLADRTVLHASSLQSAPIVLKTEKPLTHSEMMEAMRKVLDENGIVLINQGSNFVRAVFQSESAANARAVAAIPATPSVPGDAATNSVDFNGISLNTFLEVYAGQAGRTFLREPLLAATPITLKTEKPLTHSALLEAMQTVLELNGIKVTNQGSNFVQAAMTR